MSKFDIGTLSASSFEELMINFLITVCLSFLIQYSFKKHGQSLVNRNHVAPVIPLLTLTTYLVIVVVKASLALSLGLVGALSIVRFRTPIKEPETLGYLFLSIATGLALGANYRLAGILFVVLIIGGYAIAHRIRRKSSPTEMFLSLTMNGNKEVPLEKIEATLTPYSQSLDLRRADVSSSGRQFIYLVGLKRGSMISEMLSLLQRSFPDVQISFIDNTYLTPT